MNRFPIDIAKIILTYKADMELLEKQPDPHLLDFCNTAQISSYDSFVTERLLGLLYSRVPLYEVRQCIKCLLRIPARIFLNYDHAMKIFQIRCKLWDIKPTSVVHMWKETIPSVLNEFLDNNNIDNLYHKINESLTNDYLTNLDLTKTW